MIQDHIRQIVAPMLRAAHLLCVVDSVDKDNSTCSVTPIQGGAPIHNVRLRATVNAEVAGIIVYPEVGTVVSVGVTDMDLANCFVAAIERFEECLIVFEGAFELRLNRDQVMLKSDNVELGDSGGEPVVKGETLNQRLSELVSLLNNLNTALIQFATIQQSVASGVVVFAPLVPGYSQVIASLSALAPQIAAITPKLSQHLSQKVTTK